MVLNNKGEIMKKTGSSKEKTRSSELKRGHDGTTDKHSSKRIHDKAQESGGKEVSLVTLK